MTRNWSLTSQSKRDSRWQIPRVNVKTSIGVAMEEIWPVGKSRGQLEERIFELANSVPLADATAGDYDWLYSQELDQFIEAWWTLAKYYEINTDTVIGVEAMSEYVY